jgi:hypothetical protein
MSMQPARDLSKALQSLKVHGWLKITMPLWSEEIVSIELTSGPIDCVLFGDGAGAVVWVIQWRRRWGDLSYTNQF